MSTKDPEAAFSEAFAAEETARVALMQAQAVYNKARNKTARAWQAVLDAAAPARETSNSRES